MSDDSEQYNGLATRQLRQTRRFIIALLVIIAFFVMSAVTILMLRNDNKPTEQNATDIKGATTTNIKAYYSVNTPNGFVINEKTITKTDEVVAYTVDAPNNEKIFLTFQPIANESIINSFHNEKLVFSDPIESSLGDAVRGQARDNIITSIITDTTWIIVTSPQTLDQNLVNEFINSLKQE